MEDKKINALITPILRAKLGASGFLRSEVHSGNDHDGDPVLFVDVHYKPGQEPVDPEAFSAAMRAVREALAAKGEFRFPHLLHRYPDDEIATDDSSEAAE